MGDSLSRVLVVDDDAEVREAYRSFFEAQDAFKLIGEEADAVHIVAVYEQQRPDVVLMDLQMPRVSGVEAIRELHARWPKACIVAMTTFGTRDYVVAALKAGASGYLLKDVGGAALLAALHQAMQGEMPLSSAVRRALVASVLDSEVVKTREHKLAPREVELVGWLARGLSNQQIAQQMNLSEGSVKQYVVRVSEKLSVSSRTQIIVRAIQMGIVDPTALPPVGQ